MDRCDGRLSKCSEKSGSRGMQCSRPCSHESDQSSVLNARAGVLLVFGSRAGGGCARRRRDCTRLSRLIRLAAPFSDWLHPSRGGGGRRRLAAPFTRACLGCHPSLDIENLCRSSVTSRAFGHWIRLLLATPALPRRRLARFGLLGSY